MMLKQVGFYVYVEALVSPLVIIQCALAKPNPHVLKSNEPK